MSHIIFNFVQSESLSIEIKKSKSYWILIGVQFSVTFPSKFLIFIVSELLGAKIEESKTN